MNKTHVYVEAFEKIMVVSFYSMKNCGFVSISINYLCFLINFRVRCRVLLSDWSISKMNITNLALDQSERSTESWRSVIIIFALRLHGARTRTSDANVKVNVEMFVVNFSHFSFFMKISRILYFSILVKKFLNL